MIDTILIIISVVILLDIRRSQNKNKGLASSKENIIMDTSALIDGRIVEVIKSGFLPGNITVAKRVLNELQLLADGRDSHKRDRARYGLDVIADLQSIKGVKLEISDFLIDSELPTDECLLKLAKKLDGKLCTTDFNLNKVASVEDVKVLNVNELAQSLRPNALPGETVEVKIIQKGEAKGQGVGYLEDGTMTVVDNAPRMKNKMISVTVDRMIQTKAGKMVFATYRKPTK